MHRVKSSFLIPAGLFLAGFLFFGTAQAENRALLIGVGEYNHSDIPDLKGIDTDIELMREAAEIMGFSPDQMKILLNEQATSHAIPLAIEEWLINGVTGEDRVLFYFSGHGSRVPDKNGDETEDHFDEVLVPHDVIPVPNGLENVFLDDVFGEMLARMPAGEIFVFIDACHSGSATKDIRVTGPGVAAKFLHYKGLPPGRPVGPEFLGKEVTTNTRHMALSACRDDEFALASLHGSYFTRAVLSSVKTASERGRRATVTALRDEAEAYIRSNIPNPNEMFHPTVSGNLELAKDIDVLPVSAPVADIRSQLEALVNQAGYRISVKTNKTRFQLGELLEISLDIDRDGYLNILNVSPGDAEATVLFPNRLHPENRVSAGATITVPAPEDTFELYAMPPKGESLVAVFHTTEKIDIRQESGGKAADMFRQVSAKTMDRITKSVRGFGVREKEKKNTFGAEMIVTVIE